MAPDSVATTSGVTKLALLDRAVARATSWLLSRQQEDGHWVFELEADATIPAEYVLLQHYLDTIDADLEQRIARYLRATQEPHGGWSLYRGGSFDVSAKTVGLNIDLPHEQYPNPYVTPDLCVRFHYFALRKLHFVMRAKALVAFPGGFGTLDELFEILTLVQTRKMKPVPIVLVGEAHWRRAVDFDFMLDEGVIAQEDRALFWFAETAEEIWRGILQWHEAAGEPLCEMR